MNELHHYTWHQPAAARKHTRSTCLQQVQHATRVDEEEEEENKDGNHACNCCTCCRHVQLAHKVGNLLLQCSQLEHACRPSLQRSPERAARHLQHNALEEAVFARVLLARGDVGIDERPPRTQRSPRRGILQPLQRPGKNPLPSGLLARHLPPRVPGGEQRPVAPASYHLSAEGSIAHPFTEC
jgi:hypothetical protein